MAEKPWTSMVKESGSHSISLKLGQREYIASFDVSESTVEARLNEGLPALTDYAANFALWELPLNGWVELGQLPVQHVASIRALPPGFVRFRGQAVQRRTNPPVIVRSLAAVRTTATAALAAFGTTWWAPIEIAVSQSGAGPRTAARANSLGIGLVAADRWLSIPQHKRPARPTPLLWWQSELTYAAWISQRDLATA